jgi:very-short-patch-repair endonuclease
MLSEHSHLLKEFHPSKNVSIDVYSLKEKSNKKIWWKCEKEHEWEAIVCNRTKGAKCPYCTNCKVCFENSIQGKFPFLAVEWHPTKNAKTADQILPGSNQKVWWKCSINPEHEWETTPNCRCLKNTGCPHCNGKTIFGGNTIFDKYPEIAKEWHPTKNKPLEPSQVCPSSEKIVWWICPQKHEYEAKCGNRTKNNTGCLFCAGKKSSTENNLQSAFPELAKEWHPTKNTKSPNQYTSLSGIKVWWKCSKNPIHEWETAIVNRTDKKTGCPFCTGRQVDSTNNLNITHPEICKEWHPTKNGLLKPTDVTKGYGLNKIWWICSKNSKHEWHAKVANRIRGSNCPFCNMSRMERKIEEFCEKNSISFEPQKKFKGLGSLSYDFYLPIQNVLIECDGRQHFEEDQGYFHHQKSLLHQRKRDIQKNAFALKKQIPLLRISYLEEKYIDTLLSAFLLRVKREKVKITFSNPRLYKYPNYEKTSKA